MFIAPLAAVLLLAGAPVTVEVGAKKTVKMSFPMAGGDNSNPKVLKVVPDSEHLRVTFVGKSVGHATYTAIDARDPSHVFKYDVTVVPPPTPTPSPSPSPTPSAEPTATAPGAGSKE